MKTFLLNVFTSRDNETFSMSKILAISGVSAMCYNFIAHASVDFQGFGIGVSGLIAAIAVKYHVEGK